MLSLAKNSRKSWLEWFPVLVLFGVLAGAVGGLAVGVMTSHTSSSTTTAQVAGRPQDLVPPSAIASRHSGTFPKLSTGSVSAPQDVHSRTGVCTCIVRIAGADS
jgi:hypothetical protein